MTDHRDHPDYANEVNDLYRPTRPLSRDVLDQIRRNLEDIATLNEEITNPLHPMTTTVRANLMNRVHELRQQVKMMRADNRLP